VGQLDGKVVVVTGAAQGMGRRHAERCVEAGARVVATDLQVDAGRAVVAGLGDDAVFVEHDVSDEAAWDRVMATAADRFGRLDGLVNNAAVYGGTIAIEDERIESFERHLRVNVVGTWWGVKKAIAPLRAAGGGSIVNISSIAGLLGLAGFVSYGTSKWAVRGLTKIAAQELGRYGIRVNSVHPGGIAETGMYPTPQTEEERAVRLARIPLGRPGTVDDVSSLVLHLLSDASAYVTGVEHTIDGGSSLG
jgi:3alpha(or 20beta)-hydroxysteroid dehydrogenase